MDMKRHWDDVRQTKAVDAVSWFRRHLDTSLALLKRADVSAADPVIDVGGGASSFVDDLLEARFRTWRCSTSRRRLLEHLSGGDTS